LLGADDEHVFAVTAKLDPTAWFSHPERSKEAIDATIAILKAHAVAGTGDWAAIDNLPEPSRITGVASFLARMTPVIQFKQEDQFDYVALQSGVARIPEQFREKALNTWSLTWDLGRMLRARRNETLAVLAAHKARHALLAARPLQSINVEPLPSAQRTKLFLTRLRANGAAGRVTWKATDSTLASGFDVTSSGTLIGMPASCPNNRCAFDLTVGDESGREATCPIVIDVVEGL
jgi:hypothetical protein